jgi:hypothetical protein
MASIYIACVSLEAPHSRQMTSGTDSGKKIPESFGVMHCFLTHRERFTQAALVDDTAQRDVQSGRARFD